MPSFDSAQAWNLNELYGRARISTDCAHIEMTVLILDAGIDTRALGEAATLFKDAAAAFRHSV